MKMQNAVSMNAAKRTKGPGGPRITAAAGIVSLLALTAASHASVIDGFNFNGDNGTEATVAPKTVDPSVSATAISRGPGLTATGATNSYGAGGWNTATSGSFSTAIAHGDYFQVAFTVQPNETVSLSGIDLDLRQTSSGHSPNNLEFTYSFDNFATSETASTFTDTSASADYVVPTQTLTTSADLQNIAAGTTVTFRLYAYSSSPSSTMTLGIGNGNASGSPSIPYDLAIEGTAMATPEPTALGILGLCSLAVFRRPRRTPIA